MTPVPPETRYARSGDLHIAYQVFGEGELDLVLVPGYVTHVELVWEHDDWKLLDETISPGPAPILDNSAAPATASQLASALTGFTDFGSHQ